MACTRLRPCAWHEYLRPHPQCPRLRLHPAHSNRCCHLPPETHVAICSRIFCSRMDCRSGTCTGCHACSQPFQHFRQQHVRPVRDSLVSRRRGLTRNQPPDPCPDRLLSHYRQSGSQTACHRDNAMGHLQISATQPPHQERCMDNGILRHGILGGPYRQHIFTRCIISRWLNRKHHFRLAAHASCRLDRTCHAAAISVGKRQRHLQQRASGHVDGRRAGFGVLHTFFATPHASVAATRLIGRGCRCAACAGQLLPVGREKRPLFRCHHTHQLHHAT